MSDESETKSEDIEVREKRPERGLSLLDEFYPKHWGWMSDFDALFDAFRKRFDDLAWWPSRRRVEMPETMTRAVLTDIKRTDDAYVVHAELPGLSKEEVDIELDRDVLTIKGERKTETKEEKEGYVRQERSYGSFFRKIRLPDDVDPEQEIEAGLDNGLLEIKIPHSGKGEKKKKIEIK